jgi:putative peptidoglycan lipid II flippase
MGIASLAYGALAGGIIGPFLINVLGVRGTGTRYKILFDWRDAGFREWVRLSIPLMLGVSLVAADDWIMRYFANGLSGEITRLNYAKRLLAVPIAVLGQAVWQATLPFFAKLFGERKMEQFAATVSNAIFRAAALSLIASSWMAACSLPLIDLVYRRGHFNFTDSQETAVFFFWFSLSLALWSAQGLYARAFYAAGDTMTPMVAGTIITAASLPMYAALFRHCSAVGLAFASDLGILVHTVVLAILLSRKTLVPARTMAWGELGKALLVSALAWIGSVYVAALIVIDGTRRADFEFVGLASVTWAGAVAVGLWLTRSRLLADLRRGR